MIAKYYVKYIMQKRLMVNYDPSDYYNQIKNAIENSDYSEIYCDILESIDDEGFIESIEDDNCENLAAIATDFYDSIVVEKIRTYVYEIHKKGGINNYVQLVSDMQECYLDDFKNDGLYDEREGTKIADFDAKIGDGLGLYDR